MKSQFYSHVVLLKLWFSPGKENSVLGADPMATGETHEKTPDKLTGFCFMHFSGVSSEGQSPKRLPSFPLQLTAKNKKTILQHL